MVTFPGGSTAQVAVGVGRMGVGVNVLVGSGVGVSVLVDSGVGVAVGRLTAVWVKPISKVFTTNGIFKLDELTGFGPTQPQRKMIKIPARIILIKLLFVKPPKLKTIIVNNLAGSIAPNRDYNALLIHKKRVNKKVAGDQKRPE